MLLCRNFIDVDFDLIGFHHSHQFIHQSNILSYNFFKFNYATFH